MADPEELDLVKALSAARNRARDLVDSYEELRSHIPFSGQTLSAADAPLRKTIDAFLQRYMSLVAKLNDQIFRTIATLRGDDITDFTAKDKANYAEKHRFGPAADTTVIVVKLRNKLAHNYPDEDTAQAYRINETWDQTPNLILWFNQTAKWANQHLQIAADIETIAVAATKKTR